MYRVGREEALRYTITDYSGPDYSKAESQRMWDLILSGEEMLTSWQARRPGDGSVFDAEVFLTRTEMEGKTFILAFVRDITERIHAEAERQLNERRIATLFELTQIADQPEDVIISFALERAVEITRSRIGYLAFVSPDERAMTMYSWSQAAMEECRAVDKPIVYQVEETGLWGEAIRQRKAIITNDYSLENPLKKGYPEGHVQIHRHMNIPVMYDSRIVIVSGVGNKEEPYDDQDIRQLTLLMDGLWKIIRNKRADLELHAKNQELAAAEEELRSQLDEIVRIQDELRESNEYLKNLISHANTPIIVWGKDCRITLFNHALERLTGISEEEAIGSDLLILFAPEDTERVSRYIHDAAAGVRWEGLEIPILTRRGVKRIIRWNSASIVDRDGETIISTIAQGEDITDWVVAEERLRILSDNIPGGNLFQLVIQPNGERQFTYLSAGVEQLHGVGAEEVLADPTLLYRQIIFGDRERLNRAEEEAVATREPFSIEIRIRNTRGEKRWILIRSAPRRLHDGSVICEGIEIDITRQKAMEEELLKGKNELAQIIDSLPDPTFVVDADGVVVDWNRAMEELTGVTASEMVGRGEYAYAVPLYGEQRPMLIDHVRGVPGETDAYTGLRQEDDVIEAEMIEARPRGREAILWIHAIPLQDMSGRCIGAIETIRDVTKERKAVSALQERIKELSCLYQISALFEYQEIAPEEIPQHAADRIPTGYQWPEKTSARIRLYDQDYTSIGFSMTPWNQRREIVVNNEVVGEVIVCVSEEIAFLPEESVLLRTIAEMIGAYDERIRTREVLLRKNEELAAAEEETRSQLEELIKLQNELASRQEQLARIIDTLPDPTFVVDAEGVVVNWNRAMEELTGVPASEMVGRGEYAYSVPLYGEQRPMLIDHARGDAGHFGNYVTLEERNDVIVGEAVNARPLGKAVILWGQAVPLYDKEGRCTGAIETIRNITSEREAQKRLSDSEETYRRLVENLSEIIYTLDTEGRITYVSPNIDDILGIKPALAIGKRFVEFIPHEKREEQLSEFSKVLSGEKTVAEFPLFTEGGEHFWMSTTVRPVIHNGEVVTIQGILVNITDRRNAEEALRESEEKYRRLIENLSEIIYTLDTEGRITYVSPNIATIGCYSRDDVIGRAFTGFIHPDDIRGGLEMFRKVLSGGGEAMECRFVAESGEAIWSRTSARPIFKDGEVVGAQGILVDITDRRVAEEEIQLHLRRTKVLLDLHRLGDQTPDEILRFALDAGKEMTESVYSFIGLLSPDESVMSLHTWSEEVMTDCRMNHGPISLPTDHSGILSECVRSREPVIINEYAADHPAKRGCPGGHVTISRFLSVPIFDGERISAVLAVANKDEPYMQDDADALLTLGNMVSRLLQRKMADDALRMSEDRFRRLAENAEDIIYRFDLLPKPHFTYVNPAITSITGYTPEEFYANPTLGDAIMYPDDQISPRVRKEAFYSPVTLRIVRKDGKTIWMELKNVPIYNKEGEVVSVEGIARDITAAKRIGEELERSAAAITDANRKLNLMTGITRHDIANQLTVLHGYLDLSKDTVRDPTLAGYLEQMEEAAHRIERQIEFTRDYQDLGVAAPAWQLVAEILCVVEGTVMPILDETDGIIVYADPLLPKVFTNLMENTERYAEGATHVRVTCERDGEDLLIVWEDDGIGIPEEEKERIFERGVGKNTGLGLFFIREILGITGIAITEEGVYGEGARFVIRVPAGEWR
jgi:PAS domain S-box-containing protein